MRRAQAAAELLIIASLMLMILFLIFEFGETKILESTSIIQVSEARNTVDRLAKAATEVHNEGVGARRKVYITLPERLDPYKTVIANNTITLGVYVKDGINEISSRVNFPVVKGANFPSAPGSYWVGVVSREGYVQIGTTLEIEPTNVYSELFPSNSSSRNITFTNYGNSTVDVSLSLIWTDSEVSAKINDTTTLNFALFAGVENAQKVDLDVSTTINSSRGLHSGYVSVETNISENELIPVMVNVVAPSSNVSYLTIGTYNDSAHTYSDSVFMQSETVYYQVKSYNSSDGLENSTVIVRIYDPSLNLMDERTYTPNAGAGIYEGSYTLQVNAPTGTWTIKVYEAGGASTKTYFTTTAIGAVPEYIMISLATTVPFYPNQRAICRDSSNYIHVIWLYNSSLIRYANSTSNGVSWTVTNWANETPASLKNPHISCDGSNITAVYSNGSMVMKISTDNGGSWATTIPSASGVDIPLVERRGQRIYVIYKDTDAFPDINFFNSTDGGSTWGSGKVILDGQMYTGGKVTYSYFNPSFAVDGTGSANDKIYVVARAEIDCYDSNNIVCNDLDDDETTLMLENSSSSGVGWRSSGLQIGTLIVQCLTGSLTNACDYPSVTFNSSNLYVSYYDPFFNKIYFLNSSGGLSTWSSEVVNTTSNTKLYSSTTTNTAGGPSVFWQENYTNYNIVYRNNTGTNQLLPNATNKAYLANSTITDSPDQATTEFASTWYANINTSDNSYRTSTANESITRDCNSQTGGGCEDTGCMDTGSGCSANPCNPPASWCNSSLSNASSWVSTCVGGTQGCVCHRISYDPPEWFCATMGTSCSVTGSCFYTCDAGYYDTDRTDSNGCESDTPSWIFTFQRYTFNLSSYVSGGIPEFNFCWEGKYNTTGGENSSNLMWYNVTSSTWVSWQTLPYNSENTYCIEFSSANNSDVYNSTGSWVQFAARGNQSRTGYNLTIFTDFAYLNVTGWSSLVNLTTDINATYVNTKWDYSANCIELVYMNGTTSAYNITYHHIGTCMPP